MDEAKIKKLRKDLQDIIRGDEEISSISLENLTDALVYIEAALHNLGKDPKQIIYRIRPQMVVKVRTK